jgi:hypothetical protein
MSKRNVELPTLHLTGYHSMPHLRSTTQKVLSSAVIASQPLWRKLSSSTATFGRRAERCHCESTTSLPAVALCTQVDSSMSTFRAPKHGQHSTMTVRMRMQLLERCDRQVWSRTKDTVLTGL